MTGPLLAALDLGTNNCRLLLARQTGEGRFHVVESFSRITRLGEGLSANGFLSEEAMERTIEALAHCADLIARRGVLRKRLVATAACRQASNGNDFVRRAAERTGLRLEVIASEEEARLAALGCRSLLDPRTRFALVFDIGGGSTEITWVDSQKTDDQGVLACDSLPVGVVTLSERSPEARAQTLNAMRSRLEGFERRHQLRDRLARGEAGMLGTSGTVTTLGAVHLDLARYERKRVDGLMLSRTELMTVAKRLTGMSSQERASHPCIGPERADLVPAGIAIFELLNELWPAPMLGIADRGLREGLLCLLSQGVGA
jgi:exopolyphosphatase/guanosine-5'-triphosphate,3'-diphosphate pyrophosphatase